MNKHCPWTICRYNSHYNDDYPASDPHCCRKEGRCEAGEKPESYIETLQYENEQLKVQVARMRDKIEQC